MVSPEKDEIRQKADSLLFSVMHAKSASTPCLLPNEALNNSNTSIHPAAGPFDAIYCDIDWYGWIFILFIYAHLFLVNLQWKGKLPFASWLNPFEKKNRSGVRKDIVVVFFCFSAADGKIKDKIKWWNMLWKRAKYFMNWGARDNQDSCFFLALVEEVMVLMRIRSSSSDERLLFHFFFV